MNAGANGIEVLTSIYLVVQGLLRGGAVGSSSPSYGECRRFKSCPRNQTKRTVMAYARKEDQAAYAKAHYERDKARYKERAVAHKRKQVVLNREISDQAKDVPCADCGQQYPPHVMEFDHTGSDKESNISDMVFRGLSAARIQAEIEKCEVVCANCHRERTWSRKQPDKKDRDGQLS